MAAAPAQGQTLRIEGYQSFLKACDRAGKETKKYVRGTFREVGDIVRRDAVALFLPVNPKSAAAYRTYVRARGVSVETSLRRSPNPERRRPAFAAYQMRRALEPSLTRNEPRVVHEFEQALDRVCDHFEGSH